MMIEQTPLLTNTPVTNGGKFRFRAAVTAGELLRERDAAGDNGAVQIDRRFWRRLELDEWTFTLLLFLFSSSIVLGKLFLNHDSFSFLNINANQFAVPINNQNHTYNKNLTEEVVLEPLQRCSWLFKAVFSGLITTGITWFIIYEDSTVPGLNPPSPFSPSKKKIAESPSLEMNYLVGLLNGFLIFLYMCL